MENLAYSDLISIIKTKVRLPCRQFLNVPASVCSFSQPPPLPQLYLPLHIKPELPYHRYSGLRERLPQSRLEFRNLISDLFKREGGLISRCIAHRRYVGFKVK